MTTNSRPVSAVRRSVRSCSLWMFLSLLMLVTGPIAFAQGITGTITGTVSDPSGAPINGAQVTILAVDTNAARTVTTSNAGTYTVPLLKPGRYEIKVQSNGFKEYDQKGIVLAVDQVAEINVPLKVGSAQEVVEVTEALPSLQTEQSSNGLALESEQIQNTPLNGRLSLLGLLILAPGVQNLATSQDSVPGFGETLSVGSSRRNSYGSMATTLDGTVNMQISLQRDEAETPPMDALDQFKVITNGAPAEFAQQAQIIITTRSGTNQYHGELLEFNRSKGMNAKAHTFGTSTTARPPYERNEYGGYFAGPLSIPHVYEGKDKTFFFAAYEGYNYTFSTMTTSKQPTEKMRNGDFSEFLSTGSCYNGKGDVKIVNPLTGTNYYTGTGNVISSGDINSVSKQLLNILYPHPTQSGCYTNNTYENISYTQAARRFSLRLDHKLSDRDQFRGTFMHDFYGPYAYQWLSSLMGGYGSEGEHNVDTIVGWTHTITPTTILDVPASYLHLLVVRMPHRNDVNFGSIIPGLNTTQNSGAPTIAISNNSGTNLYSGSLTSVSDNGGGHPGLEQDFQFSPTLTMVFPKHTVKAGFSGVYSSFFDSSYSSKGSFTFSTSISGDSFADFLLGVPTSTANNLYSGQYPRHLMETQMGAFVQDDWKVLPNLTVNLGVRWDKQHFFDDPYHRAVLFVPEQSKVVYFGNSIPSTAISSFTTALNKYSMLETSSQAGMSSNPYDYLNEPSNNFAPRLGFAWQPFSKTVVRGAYGIFFNLLAPQYVSTWQGNVPFVGAAAYTNSSTAYNGSYFTMSNPFVTSGSTSSNFEIDAQAKSKTPYSETYNLEVERELPYQINLRVGYAGQRNIKQNNNGQTSYVNLNLAKGDGNPVTYTTSTALQNSYLYQPLSAALLQDYPWYFSNLNSLQIGMHKRYQGGSSINAEFQWTRLLGVESFMDYTGSHPKDSYGPIGGLTPLVLNLNYTYALPVGRGHLLLGHAGNLVDKILGGWQYSGVGTFQSGQPFSVTFDYSGSTAYGNQRANRVPGVALYPKHKTVSQWFNTAAFQAPAYTVDSTNSAIKHYPYGNSSYNMLRGPGWWNMDMNLQKNIKWGSRYNVLLRADSFNVFNHANFGVPTSDISSSSAGVVSTNSTSTPVYQQRSVELGAKFTF